MSTEVSEIPGRVDGTTESKIVLQTRLWLGAEWTNIVVWEDGPGAIEDARKFMATDVRGYHMISGNERLTRQITVTVVLDP